MSANSQPRLSAEQLAEQFLDSHQRGHQPDLDSYVANYPEQAGEIREFVSALMMLRESDSVKAMPEETVEPEVGQFGRFRILRELGRGTMAVVYEAASDTLGRIALKVLPRERAGRPEYRRRFEREARFLARLNHNIITRIFDFGVRNGLPYQALQYVEGRSFDQVLGELRRRRNFPAGSSPLDDALLSEICDAMTSRAGGDSKQHYFRRVVDMGQQIADALAHVHDQGILHCDIKPANVMVDADGTPWLTDFGLARDINEGTQTKLEGTPRYMAPERFQGQTDVRSDIYALGITLYEMATLQPAFSVLEKSLLIRQIQQVQPPAPSQLEPATPPGLEKIILKAIAKNPERRYASARELAEALNHIS